MQNKKAVPINCFAPGEAHAGQLEVMNDPARFKLLRCGRKWRKTSLLVSWLFEGAIASKNGGTFTFIMPYLSQAQTDVWNDHVQRVLTEFDKKGFSYRKTEKPMSVELLNGSRVIFLGADNEKSLRSASTWKRVAIDEYDDWKSFRIWESIIEPNLMVHQAPVIIAGTPKGKLNMYKLELEGDFKVFHYTSHQNPELSRDEITRLENKWRKKGEDYFQQEIMAEYIKPAGVVFPEFNINTHVIEPFEIPSHWDIYRSIDLGQNNPTGCLWIAVDPESNYYCIDEYYETDKSTGEHAEKIMLKTGKRNIKATIIDENGLGKQLLLDYNSYGLKAMGQKHAPVTDGIARLKEKIKQNPFTGKPSFFIFKQRCPNLIMELENYRWEESKDDFYQKEKPMKGFDHLIDCARNLAITFGIKKSYSQDNTEKTRKQVKRKGAFSLTGY